MEASKIEITHSDQSKNTLNIFAHPSHNGAEVFVIFPAMGIRASFYAPFAIALANKKKCAITVDLRGNGNSSIRPSKTVNFGYKEQLDYEYAHTFQKVKSLYPNNKIYLIGHSLGGQLGALYTSHQIQKIEGLILIACCSVYYKGWTGFGQFKTYFFSQLFNCIAAVLGFFPGKKIGFGGLEAKGVMKDWSQQARTGNYVLENSSFDYETALKKLNIPVLAISFESDTLAPQNAVKHLYQKFGDQHKINHLHLLEKDPRNDQFNHFNWVKKPDKIISIISDWIHQ